MAQPKNAQEQTVVDFFRILSSGDLEALREFLHPDASWTPMLKPGIPGAGVHHPRDAIIDGFLAPVRGLFKPGDPKVHIDAIISDGDRIMVESSSTGTLSDGRKYDNLYAWAFELKDGKVWKIREYMDSAYVASLFPDGG
jgi:uncharacterized protein